VHLDGAMNNPTITKQVEKLETLADEVRLKLHLASLDARKEWDEKIAPRLLELRQAPAEKIEELTKLVEGYLARLGTNQPA
jgi:hypothetical protein